MSSTKTVENENASENEKNTNIGSSSEVPSSAPTNASDDVIDLTTVLEEKCLKRRKTSPYWEHFEEKKLGAKTVAICKYCKRTLQASSNNGTTSLKNHLKSCAAYKNGCTIEKTLENQKQLVMEKKNDGKVRFGNFTFDQEISRNALAAAIVLHEYPLSMVDHEGFKIFIASLQPLFKMVSRNTIKEDILKLYKMEKLKLQSLFEKLKSRVAITTDMWTSNQRKGYMVVTAHFISDYWVLESRILSFAYVPTPHTKEVLAQELMGVLTEWNIETMISTITVDNCSTNDGMISIIEEKLFSELLLNGKVFHMRCCAHILNLVVKDGLSIINDAIESIRDSVAYWSASPSRVEKFEEVARQLKISYDKKLSIDCKTRWNSTYLMLQTAIEYKDIFPRLTLRDKYYKFAPCESEWEMATKIASKLEIFYNVTRLFSGTNYPTANCYFVHICQLRNAIVKWMLDDDDIICTMAKQMYEKFEKYWNVVHVVLAVAVVLDPRFKMKVVEYYFPEIYGGDASFEIEQVKRNCYSLLEQYQGKSSKRSAKSPQTSRSTSPAKASSVSRSEDMTKLVAFLSNSSSCTLVKSELDHYLDEPVLPWTQDFDILNWWKTNGIKYPTLQIIARDFLAIPISTVASESAFSTSGRIVSDTRSRLHPETTKALMCTQNWLKNQRDGSNLVAESSYMLDREWED